MRVLHCIDTLGAGGAERQLSYLADGLVRSGHEVDVAYFDGGPFEEQLRRSGAALHRIDRSSAVTQLYGVHRTIRHRRPDVVHTWLGRMNVVGGLASFGRRWIYSERSVRLHDRGLPGLVRQWLGARSSLLVANSEAGARLWRPVRPRGVEVVPNGLPVDEIAATPTASRASLGLDERAELILWAGRFVPAKNIELLGEVLASVLAARPRAVAWCCGEGELAARLRALVDRRGVGGRCVLPGRRADLWALLKTADVLLSPSRAEGQPNVVLEAMSAGCPLVLSDIDAHRELVPDEAGRFFRRDDAGDAIAGVLGVLDDPSAARARAARARELVRNRSIDAMVRAYLRLYQDLLARA